jgi:mycoredoxin
MTEQITVYGTHWCPDCRRARNILDKHHIVYRWIDIEQDPAAADYVMKVNRGNRSVPTIVFRDGSILVEPGNSELEVKLKYP